MESTWKLYVHIFLLLTIASMPSAQYYDWTYNPYNITSLRNDLLKNYDRLVRPTSPTYVYLDMVLFSLNDLNIESQMMSLTGIIYLIWGDWRLRWDPKGYSNTSTIQVESGTVWQPKLLVENSVNTMKSIGSEEAPLVRLYSNGAAKWLVPVNLMVYCEMKILSFPFDTQSCQIRIYAWSQDIKEVQVAYEADEGVFMYYYVPNGEWDYVGSSKSKTNATDGPETYMKVIIELTFRRKWIFLSLTLIVPAVLNSVLMTAVFALPFESGEKMGYSLTVLLTYIVLLTLVADSLPPISTEISALQIYLTGVMCMGTVATLLTVWTVTVYNQDPEKPRPKWVIYMCQKVLKPCLCGSCKKKSQNKTSVHNISHRPASSSNSTSWATEIGHSGPPNPNGEGEFYHNHNRGDLYPTRIIPTFSAGQRSLPTTCFERDALHNWKHEKYSGLHRGQIPHSVFVDENPGYHTANIHSRTETPERKIREPGPENDEMPDNDDVSWTEVAELMDSLFLRIVGLFITGGTLALFISFIVFYN